MAEKDYYKVLGVSSGASQEEIRKAYRKLAKKHHPDRHGGSKGAEETFKGISDAYSVLGDPEKRKQYDLLRQAGMSGSSFGGMPGFEDLFARTGGRAWRSGEGLHFEDLGGLGDLFSKMFGGGRTGARRSATQRGGNVMTTITVPFETAVEGGKVQVRVTREKACPGCKGSGAAPGSSVDSCPHCRGTGQVLTGQGAFSVARPCPACFGRGKVIQKPCGRCRGAGSVEEPSRVEVTIPRGIQDGQKIRLAGLGQPGVGGGKAGDLLIEIKVRPHPKFQRKGRSTYSKTRLDMVDAALGVDIDVETLHGMVTVKVPAGTQPGQKLRIARYGLETSDGRRGDHYVTIEVTVPKDLTPDQKRLLGQLQQKPAGARK